MARGDRVAAPHCALAGRVDVPGAVDFDGGQAIMGGVVEDEAHGQGPAPLQLELTHLRGV